MRGENVQPRLSTPTFPCKLWPYHFMANSLTKSARDTMPLAWLSVSELIKHLMCFLSISSIALCSVSSSFTVTDFVVMRSSTIVSIFSGECTPLSPALGMQSFADLLAG